MPRSSLGSSAGPPPAASSSFARSHGIDASNNAKRAKAAASQPGFSSALMKNRFRKVQEQQRADEPASQYDMDLSDNEYSDDDGWQDGRGQGLDSDDEDVEEIKKATRRQSSMPPNGALLESPENEPRISDKTAQERWNMSMSQFPKRPVARSYDVSYRANSDHAHGPSSPDGDEGEELHRSSSEGSMSNSEEDEESENEQERYAWQNMLANVLEGDVLKSEKNRLSGTAIHQLDDSSGQRKYQMRQIWLGIRAFVRNRTIEAETRFLHEARAHITAIFNDVANFKIQAPADESPETSAAQAAEQVQILLAKTQWAMSLYPSIAALRSANEMANKQEIIDRLDALQSWITITTRLQMYLGILQKWTGSETLEITKPNLEKLGDPASPAIETDTQRKILDSSTFVERMLKEESLTSTFAKGILTDIYPLIQAAKETIIANRAHFTEIGLPPFSDDLIAIINFPMNLMREAIFLRLDSASRVNKDDPSIVLIDQLTDDFRAGLTLATQMKKNYLETIHPDPEGGWVLPPVSLDSFNSVLQDALRFFFKLLHWKLKSGSKAIYLKETDIVEREWNFLSRAVEMIDGGDLLIAEHFSMLTHRLILRVLAYVNETLDILARRQMSASKVTRWFNQTLDNVRQRHRKLLRFGKAIVQRFENATEFDMETPNHKLDLGLFIGALAETDHFLVYTGLTEQKGIYLIASGSLHDRPDVITRILTRCYVAHTQPDYIPFEDEEEPESSNEVRYVILLSPHDPFIWTGRVMSLDGLPAVVPELDLRDMRIRLVAEGPDALLMESRALLFELFPLLPRLIINERHAHLARVNRDVKKIKAATYRLGESIVTSAAKIQTIVRDMEGGEGLLATYFSFAADLGLRSLRSFEQKFKARLNIELQRFAIQWVHFICEDCVPSDARTFKWAVAALEFARVVTRGNNIFNLSTDDFLLLRSGVASCMTLLISHFDILGARSSVETRKQRERLDAESQEARKAIQDKLAAMQSGRLDLDREADFALVEQLGNASGLTSLRARRSRWTEKLAELDEHRAEVEAGMRMVGKVLSHGRPEDRSLLSLASSASNINIRWQQGRFIGAGTYGTVYLAVNLDSGDAMAVKEIRFQDSASAPTLIKEIHDEMSVMSMIHHPNIVDYYGIEVHRDKVYIFEEYCQGGSLASLLEHGRIEDETVLQLYTYQLLDGLIYLHQQGVVHRDIKPDNILIDGNGMMKLADFGSAKVLVKKAMTLAGRTRNNRAYQANNDDLPVPAGAPQNTLSGTPMYMSPEVIKGEKSDMKGAMDIWSLGCVMLECATGKRPWAGLDNEWAIMFHIGVAKEHPPLPDPSQLSELGIDFIKCCLTIEVNKRPTAEELLSHPWIQGFTEELYGQQEEADGSDESEFLPYGAGDEVKEETIVQEVENGTSENRPLNPISVPLTSLAEEEEEEEEEEANPTAQHMDHGMSDP